MHWLTIHWRLTGFVGAFTALVFLLMPGCIASPQDSESRSLSPPLTTSVELPNKDQEEPRAEESADEHSDATRIADLQESLEDDETQLQKLEAELENPNSEYCRAEDAFRELKAELEAESEKLELARQAGTATQRLEQEVASIERQRQLAEDRFDLAIEDRKTLREQIVTLHGKIKKDHQALDDLTGETSSLAENDSAMSEHETSSENRDTTASVRDHRNEKHDHEESSHRDSERDGEETHLSNNNDDESKKARDVESEEEMEQDAEEAEDEELTEAKAEAEEKEQEAEEAQEETGSLAARLADLQKLVSQEQKELSLARKKVDLVSATQQALSGELTKRQAEQADPKELAELRSALSDASQRLIPARAEVAEINERLNDHRSELGILQSEHILALHEAEKKRHEAAVAAELVKTLRNPFTLRNMQQWFLDHGPPLLIIVVGMFALNFIASFFSARSVRLVSSGTGRGSTVERENRAKTLVGVFQNAATVAIFITGIFMTLEEIGANIRVLMGGVAVIGLAVAFGAQNLIKDYFYGFVMLLENQYMLNDSIRVGEVSGQVERITLRMTVLRDSNGVVHFIPNGTINSVSNETHGWSRAVIEIAVGYDEDLDRVIAALKEIATGLRKDASLGALLLDNPSDPAIDTLGESAIQLKTSVKTLPNKQGAVKQEWFRRIRHRFAELGIEPAYPQRTLRIHPADLDELRIAQLRKRNAS